MKIKKKTFGLVILGLFVMMLFAFIIASRPQEIKNEIQEGETQYRNDINTSEVEKYNIITAFNAPGVPNVFFILFFFITTMIIWSVFRRGG